MPRDPIGQPPVSDPPSAGSMPPDYRLFVGPPDKYDLVAAMQFNVLTLLGLREQHSLLDIGCGSLRGGRLFIPYLLPERYHGIEPEAWLVEEGIKHELGADAIQLKRPRFSHDSDFTLSIFGRHFDYLLAQSVFSHAAPAQIRRCVAEARRVMDSSSIFALTYFDGPESYSGTEWSYPYGVAYRFEDLLDIVQREGLTAGRLTWPHPNGQRWMVVFKPGEQHRIPENLRETSDFVAP